MRDKIIHEAEGERTFAIILEEGDEALKCLTEFAQANALQAASFSAIGALSGATLAFFDWDRKEYMPIPVDEQVEVASLTGDVAIGPDDKPTLHIHAVLGRRDGSALAGHLQRAVVRPTLEVILTEAPSFLRKRLIPEIGIALIDPLI